MEQGHPQDVARCRALAPVPLQQRRRRGADHGDKAHSVIDHAQSVPVLASRYLAVQQRLVPGPDTCVSVLQCCALLRYHLVHPAVATPCPEPRPRIDERELATPLGGDPFHPACPQICLVLAVLFRLVSSSGWRSRGTSTRDSSPSSDKLCAKETWAPIYATQNLHLRSTAGDGNLRMAHGHPNFRWQSSKWRGST